MTKRKLETGSQRLGFIFTALVFIILSCNLAYAKKQDTSISLLYYEMGLKYHKSSDLENAAVYLKNVLTVNPSDLAALIELGEIYIESSKYDLAISHLKKAIVLYPDDTLAHELLGIAYLENKQASDAISEFKLASKLEPDNTLLKANLGLACSLINDHKCAIENLGKVVLAYPYQLRVRAALGTAYHSIKNYGLAKEQYKFVLEYELTNITLWYNLAKVELALSEYEGAKSSIDKAISLDNKVVDFYLDRAQISYKLNKLTDSESDYLIALQLAPANPEVPVEYAIFLWRTGAYLKAAEQFEKAQALSQGDKSLLVNKAYMFQLAKKDKEAVNAWQEVLDQDNENATAIFNLARLYQEKGDYESAISFYKKLISLEESKNNFDFEANSGLAYSLQKNKNFSEAKLIHEKILSKMPDDSVTFYNLGVLYLEEKDYKQAVSYLDKAIKNKFSPLKDVYQALVEAYTHLNDVTSLRTAYKNWLDIDKDNINARISYAKFLAHQGDSLGAIDQYKAVVALDSTGKSRYKLAEFLLEQKDLYGAVGQLQEYLKSEPNNLNALILLANAFKDLGIHEQAINTYKKIIAIQVDSHLTYYNLGLLYEQEKKYEEAQNYLLKAIELNDRYAPAYYALGLSYMVSEISENKNKAKELFQKYLQLEPNGEYKDKVESKLKELTDNPIANQSGI